MKKNVPIIGRNETVEVLSIPTLECPFCKSVVSPILLAAFSNTDDGRRHFMASYPCCRGYYFVSCSNTDKEIDILSEWKNDPLPVVGPKQFSSVINAISPKFEKIYNEAFVAKKQGLLEICGGGFRKALDFLVYDYVVLKHPDKEDEIRKMGQLGNVISTFINDKKLNAHISAASWLGNDEVHYTRKYEDEDVNSLLDFIDDVVEYIELDEKLEDKLRIMPDLRRKILK